MSEMLSRPAKFSLALNSTERADNDWTYARLVFDSAEKAEVELGPRLSHWSCPATGAAWFDENLLF